MFLAMLVAWSFPAQAAPGWVRNNGQWPAQVLASLDWPSSRIFLEKNRLVYHFLDEEAMRTAHEAGIGGETPLKAHAIYIYFEGASPAPTLELEGSSKEKVNYFFGIKLSVFIWN